MLNLSSLTTALLKEYKQIRQQQQVDGSPKLEVSETVTFFGSIYEKMRNAVEFRETNLIRKAAVERILRRFINNDYTSEEFTEPLIRELMWGKYLNSEEVSIEDLEKLKKISKNYLDIRAKAIRSVEDREQKNEVSDWIIEILACRIENFLAPDKKREAIINYIYQWIHPSINLEQETNQETKNIQTLLAVYEAYNKADKALLKYQFIRYYGEDNLFTDFWKTYKLTNKHLNNPLRSRITRYINKQKPPFIILADILNLNRADLEEELISTKNIDLDRDLRKQILSRKSLLNKTISLVCKRKYNNLGDRLKRAATRSVVYLFVTKMIVALILEIPADRLLEGKIDIIPLTINVIFPPVLMLFIALIISPPGKDNTQRIQKRLKQILITNHFKSEVRTFTGKAKVSKPFLILIFTIIYGITFILTFGGIIWLLTWIGFNIVSQVIFLFFLTVVSFFAYRVKQIPKELIFKEKEGVFKPVLDFLTLPILEVGKKLSIGIGKLNFVTFIFDFILEAQFKAVFEVIEAWVGFIRTRKEEIA